MRVTLPELVIEVHHASAVSSCDDDEIRPLTERSVPGAFGPEVLDLVTSLRDELDQTFACVIVIPGCRVMDQDYSHRMFSCSIRAVRNRRGLGWLNVQ